MDFDKDMIKDYAMKFFRNLYTMEDNYYTPYLLASWAIYCLYSYIITIAHPVFHLTRYLFWRSSIAI